MMAHALRVAEALMRASARFHEHPIANGKDLPHGNKLQDLRPPVEESASAAEAEERVDPDTGHQALGFMGGRTWHEICVTETGKAHSGLNRNPAESDSSD